MVIKNVELETVCGITSRIPDNTLPEIAFAGKSNVGKSSLINALMNRRSLARTSSRPGKTQTINFYNINGALYLVDLPGYGYASANVEIRAQWGKMIENYLHVSKQLLAVFLLIDIRHDPSDNDRMMYDWMMSQGYAPIVIATKADKLKRSQLPRHLEAVREGLQVKEDAVVIPFSSVTKQGREEIWNVMDRLAGILPDDPDGGPESGGDGESGGAGKGGPGRTDGRRVTGSGSGEGKKPGGAGNPPDRERKQRWKAAGKPTAKKTRRNRERRRRG